jgi:hypothetical protein
MKHLVDYVSLQFLIINNNVSQAQRVQTSGPEGENVL